MTDMPGQTSPPAGLGGRLTGWPAAVVVLGGFYALMVSSLAGKCVTSDEVVHLAGGYAYWRFNDYRINPENGVLPQRLAGLAVQRGWRFPPREGAAWNGSDEWALGREFLYASGNNAGAMLLAGRMACGLLAVAMGALVYAWSRQLFGRGGGMLSLLLCVLSPIVLANGALITSDMAAGTFFLGSLWALGALLEDVRPRTVAVSALAMAGLFVSKMQAAAILPVAVALLAVRVLARRPLRVRFGPARQVRRRGARVLVLAGAALAHAAVVVGVIWAFYGFRYEMMNARTSQDRPMTVWEAVLDWPVPYTQIENLALTDEQLAELDRIMAPAHGQAELIGSPDRRAEILAEAYDTFRREVLTDRQRTKLGQAAPHSAPAAVGFVNFLRAHRLVPEAYIYGHAYVLRYSRGRQAFLNGEVSDTGWTRFFPYVFLVKTPLPVLAVVLLAGAAAGVAWGRAKRRGGAGIARSAVKAMEATLPLWLFMAVYWALVIGSRINIGHRHLLPAYGPMFILAGAAGYWLRAGPVGRRGIGRLFEAVRSRPAGAMVAGLMLLLAAEMLVVWPNYLPYFNQFVGESRGYQHLVDSSLDWGQDLPALKRFIDRRRAGDPGRRIYVSYFGNGDLDYYGIEATLLPSFPPVHQEKRPTVVLRWTGADQAGRRTAGPGQPGQEFFPVRARQEIRDGQVVTATAFLKRPRHLRLTAGTYCISASMLQPILYDHYKGPWCRKYERAYQSGKELTGLIQHSDDEDALRRFLLAKKVDDLTGFFGRYESLRLARLCAYLRGREPTRQVNYSILVYDLSDRDIAEAMEGPSPPQGPDRDAAGQ